MINVNEQIQGRTSFGNRWFQEDNGEADGNINGEEAEIVDDEDEQYCVFKTEMNNSEYLFICIKLALWIYEHKTF